MHTAHPPCHQCPSYPYGLHHMLTASTTCSQHPPLTTHPHHHPLTHYTLTYLPLAHYPLTNIPQPEPYTPTQPQSQRNSPSSKVTYWRSSACKMTGGGRQKCGNHVVKSVESVWCRVITCSGVKCGVLRYGRSAGVLGEREGVGR
jgi:hypothetical protein